MPLFIGLRSQSVWDYPFLSAFMGSWEKTLKGKWGDGNLVGWKECYFIRINMYGWFLGDQLAPQMWSECYSGILPKKKFLCLVQVEESFNSYIWHWDRGLEQFLFNSKQQWKCVFGVLGGRLAQWRVHNGLITICEL